jgi:hypothetical protein
MGAKREGRRLIDRGKRPMSLAQLESSSSIVSSLSGRIGTRRGFVILCKGYRLFEGIRLAHPLCRPST